MHDHSPTESCSPEPHTERLALGMPPLTLVSADVALNTAAAAEGILGEDPNAHP
jgi:hypothetical protein